MNPALNRLRLALKTLSQLGVRPVALYGLYQIGLRSGHYRRLDSSLLRTAQQAARSPLPPFPLPDPQKLKRNLSPAARQSLIHEANSITAGRVRLFGDKTVPLQLAYRGRLQHWTAYEKDRHLLSALIAPQSDIKFTWELARFGWAYTLGRAFHISRNEKYARLFWAHFDRFEKGNPPYRGPHWMNGQEVALRLMALVWSAQVFGSARASGVRRLARLGRAIAKHAARIPPTLVYARSQENNHLITESTALYLAGVALGHAPWRDLGWRWLNRGLRRQIGPDGEYIQHSTNYHRLMLQSVLLADAARRARQDSWPAATRQSLARAAHWLFSRIDPQSGRAPNTGANDGALILPLSSSDFDDYRPTVQAAARAFLRTALPAGDWDELSIWLGLPANNQAASSAAYLAEHLRSRDAWAYLRASSFKSRLSHMDQLHLDLWWRGLNIASDAGSFLYNAPPPWDNPLVSSRIHNLVTVDGLEQMARAGRFLVLDWFPAYSKHVLSADLPTLGQVTSTHRGYERLGIRYQRTLSLLEGNRWRVRDDLLFRHPAVHTLRLHWLLFDGDWSLRQRGLETSLRMYVPGGRINVTITAAGFLAAPHVALIRAGKILQGNAQAYLHEGWISPTYGRKVPALSLALEASASGTCSFTTEFALPG